MFEKISDWLLERKSFVLDESKNTRIIDMTQPKADNTLEIVERSEKVVEIRLNGQVVKRTRVSAFVVCSPPVQSGDIIELKDVLGKTVAALVDKVDDLECNNNSFVNIYLIGYFEKEEENV